LHNSAPGRNAALLERKLPLTFLGSIRSSFCLILSAE
jgi:hypothetical protein